MHISYFEKQIFLRARRLIRVLLRDFCAQFSVWCICVLRAYIKSLFIGLNLKGLHHSDFQFSDTTLVDSRAVDATAVDGYVQQLRFDTRLEGANSTVGGR
jgi:hypothetical protein